MHRSSTRAPSSGLPRLSPPPGACRRPITRARGCRQQLLRFRRCCLGLRGARCYQQPPGPSVKAQGSARALRFVTLCAAQGLQKRPGPQKRGGCSTWHWVTWRTPRGCARPAGHMGQTRRGNFALTSSSRDWQKAARKSSFHPFTPCLQQQKKKGNRRKKWEEETGAPKRRVPAPRGPSPNPSSQGPSAAGEVTHAAAAHAVLGDLYRRTGIYQSAV